MREKANIPHVPVETGTELRPNPLLSWTISSLRVAEPVKTKAPGTDWPPAGCHEGWHTLSLGLPTCNCGDWLQGTRAPPVSQGQQQPGSLAGRQVGSETEKEQSSGVFLENSAEIVGSPGGFHCPSKKRHLLDLGREVGPSEERQVDLSQYL